MHTSKSKWCVWIILFRTHLVWKSAVTPYLCIIQSNMMSTTRKDHCWSTTHTAYLRIHNAFTPRNICMYCMHIHAYVSRLRTRWELHTDVCMHTTWRTYFWNAQLRIKSPTKGTIVRTQYPRTKKKGKLSRIIYIQNRIHIISHLFAFHLHNVTCTRTIYTENILIK